MTPPPELGVEVTGGWDVVVAEGLLVVCTSDVVNATDTLEVLKVGLLLKIC